MISTAGKTQSDIFTSSLTLIPQHFYFAENFAKAFAKVPMATLLWNGVVVCCLIFFFQVVVAIPCAYAMAKLKFRAARLMMVLVMLGLLVPIHATALPLYVAFDKMSLLNSYTSLVAPFTISVFAIFMFLQFFRAMPDDLLHAARLDGMSELGIIAGVIVPCVAGGHRLRDLFRRRALERPLLAADRRQQAGLRHTAARPDVFPGRRGRRRLRRADGRHADHHPPARRRLLLAQRRFVEGITMTGLKG